ncbi:polysaccharide lyase family 8 super-sandwich domain-containing protein [Sinomicrobium weinanense]|uniref:DNRLRE domain-containing protein n=1 Tax=Sinomicrobium weinanense TaxID=2842200 RepID=A0A926Q0B0_9FLAO|nr:polysaccharide lyase family 8 super-sandwich domain-containing protein [Sinomicrobium weinanense]MBC9794663.1 DNRLRE domain-containing protein [Sinomicrobium weinanense]MBU3124148.1 DNRLRE domain-containing protein [Sinomicrobium weinanense]
MKKNYTFIILILLSFSFIASAQTDFEQIMQQIRAENSKKITDIAALDNTVTGLLSDLNGDGSWPDIDYTSTSFTDWKPVIHLDRVIHMANAYTTSGSSYYQDANLHSSIQSALSFWDNSDPQSGNWWYNQIACPQRLGLMLIVLRSGAIPVDSTLENNLITQMNRGDPAKQAGANKLDIALHYIYRGCLSADSGVLQTGIDESFYPLSLTTAEGVQHDYSYQQHGPQLYIAGYGTVFVNTTVKVATYLAGTSYALSGSKLDILTNFIRNTYTQVIRGQYMDFSVNGRSIARKNNLLSSGFAGTLTKLKDIDPAHIAEYDDIIARLNGTQAAGYQVNELQTQYWRSDYALYNSPGYSFSVRTASARTSKTENGNGENLKGYFLSDGATNIRVDGDEYYNIFPVWEWNKIPGVTAPELASIPLRRQWQVPGTSGFTGGVSDSIHGIKVFALDEYGLQAKKGWFFFGEEVVCLGAGIHATAAEPILTTVNQALLDGNITIGQNGSATQPGPGTHTYDNTADWVLHDKVAYFFPEKGKLTVRNQTQTGSWGSISNSYTSDPVSEDVFTMWMDHGTQPSGASYAYIVVPDKETQAEVEAYDPSQINIIENNENIQAVRHETLGILQIAFYSAGTYERDSVKITVDKPCTLIVKDTESPEVTIHIADPGQRQSLINVYTDFPAIEKTRHLACEMPTGEYAGSGKAFTVNSETPVYVPKPGTEVGIAPTDDAYVRDGTYADVNYGTDNVLIVKNDGTSYARETFLKFDLGHIDGKIIDATLKLYISSANTNVTSTQWELKYVGDDTWNENSILWNNKPAASEVIASTPGQSWGTAEWNVSQKVIEEFEKDSILSLQVSSTVAGPTTDVVFYSKETSTPDVVPVLVLTVDNSTISNEMEPVDDTYVRGGTYSGENYGASTGLVVKNDSESYTRETYLKFDLSQIEGDIVDAQLSMSLIGANTDVNLTSWDVKAIGDDSWDESTLTWNGKPALGALLTSEQGISGGTMTWNVTQQTIQEHQDDKSLSLHLSSTYPGAKTDATFYSKEASDPGLRPKLTIRVDKCSVNPVTVTITGDNKVYTGYKDANCTTLSATASGGTENYTYLWNTGETSSNIQPCPDETTTYTVTVTDTSGCSATQNFTVYTENVAEESSEKGMDRIVICYKGQTIYVARNKADDMLRKGATLGKCDEEKTSNTEAVVSASASPNPTTGPVDIHIENENNDIETQILVFNSNGQCVLKKSTRLNKGFNDFSINLSHKRPGIYFIKIPGVYHENNALKVIKL